MGEQSVSAAPADITQKVYGYPRDLYLLKCRPIATISHLESMQESDNDGQVMRPFTNMTTSLTKNWIDAMLRINVSLKRYENVKKFLLWA